MSAISFLAGLGAGYLQEDDKATERKRQAKLDQITIDRAGREADTFNEAKSNRIAMRTAAAPLPVETVDGIGPPDENGATPSPSYRVGAAQFADQGAATVAANDPTARDARIASTMRGIDPTQAQQFEASNKQAQLTDVQLKQHIQTAQDEGTMRSLSLALSGASPSDVEASFNASGKSKVHNLKFTPIDVNHPVLGPQKSLMITGTRDDGQPFVLPDAVDASFKLFSAEKQFGMLVDAKKDTTKNAKDDRQQTREEAAQKSLSRYHDAIAEAAGVRAEKTGSGRAAGSGVDRMSEADKEEYKGTKEQSRMIGSEIAKGIASGTLAMEEKDGAKPVKNAAWRQLETLLATQNMRGRAILDRYAAEEETPDPNGLRKPAASAAVGASAGASPTRVDPATQNVRDVAAGKQMVLSEFGGDVGRARSELAAMQDGIRKAPSGEAKAMLQGQAQRLQLGIDAMAATPAPARMAAAGVAPPSPAVPTAAPLAAIPAARAASPVDVVGQKLDVARLATSSARTALMKYGQRQRAQDPQGYAAAVAAAQAAKDQQSQAEAAYAEVVNSVDDPKASFRYSKP